MIEGAGLVELAKSLGGLAGPSLRRLSDERAGPILGKVPSLLYKIFDETLSRLTQGKLEDRWWKTLRERVRFESTKPPKFLRAPTFQEWLQDEANREDVRALAKARVLHREEDAHAMQRLQDSLKQHTGETQQISERIEIVVGLLVAGFQIGVADEAHPVVALQQATLEGQAELKELIQEPRAASVPSGPETSDTLEEDQPSEEPKDRIETTPLDRDTHKKELAGSLATLLHNQDLAIAALIEAATAERSNRRAPAPEWGQIKIDSEASRKLAEAICDTEIGPVLVACNSAYQTLRATGDASAAEDRSLYRKASDTVDRLVSKVAPYLTAFKVGLQVPDQQGGLFQLPCRKPTVFEMLMARVEGRQPHWKTLSDQRQYPEGRPRLAIPLVEVGAVTGQELWVFARSLAKRVFHPNDLPSAFGRDICPTGPELEDAMKLLNAEIEGIAGRELEPFRYYLILDEVPTGWDVERLAEDLKQHLPAIWLLQSNGGDELEEVRWCQPLRELLFTRQRASERSRSEKETP